MVGSWEVKVSVGSMPEKVATAFGKLNELVGAEYTAIAYLGSQPVNGINHAVLAEQLVITGKDTKNVVLVIFNEKPGSMEPLTLVSIERVVEGGSGFGGTQVEVATGILPDEPQAAIDEAFEGFTGSKIETIALLGTQVTKGVNYIYAVTITPVVQNPDARVAVLTVNNMTKNVTFTDLLASKNDLLSLSYAFTWLKNGVSLGVPLGEWP